MIRKTKIVCTLGPASDSEEMISKLMDAGMNVCRLNMSHGSYEEQGARIDRIKRLRREKNIPVAIMLDTKGPEVRTKTLKADKVTLQAGQEFILTSRDIEGDETQVAITYPRMVELVHPGNRILIDDGLIDSLDIVAVVTDLMDTFDVQLGVDDLTPENFNSVEAIGRYDRYMLRSFDCRNERVHSGFIRDDLLCELL